jgi:ATP/ADP translocase
MQVSSSIIDYQFNVVLEHTIIGKDLRTQYTARILGIVQVAVLLLQFIGSFLLVHFLGVRRSHFLIPALLCLSSISFLLFPTFGVISFAFMMIKCFDFSLFGVLREMLYVPLKLDEKFRAKAVIDVFAHRTAKAASSILILVLQALIGLQTVSVLTWSSILLFSLWCGVVLYMLREPKALPIQER